eukprot:198831_1
MHKILVLVISIGLLKAAEDETLNTTDGMRDSVMLHETEAVTYPQGGVGRREYVRAPHVQQADVQPVVAQPEEIRRQPPPEIMLFDGFELSNKWILAILFAPCTVCVISKCIGKFYPDEEYVEQNSIVIQTA